jgi:hypothetical protein
MLVAAAVVAMLMGCGGGDDDSGGGVPSTSGSTSTAGSGSSSESSSGGPPVTTSSLSKAEFIKKATVACELERKNLVTEVTDFMSEGLKEGKNEKALIASMAKVVMVPTVEAEMDAIRTIGVPAGDEDEIEAILATEQGGIEEVKQLKSADDLEEIEDHFTEATKKFRAYGFEACTNSPFE